MQKVPGEASVPAERVVLEPVKQLLSQNQFEGNPEVLIFHDCCITLF